MRWTVSFTLHVQTPEGPSASSSHVPGEFRHRQQPSQGWKISVLHPVPMGFSYASYSFFVEQDPEHRYFFFSKVNASCSLNYISVGNWGPLTSVSSVFFPAVSLYVDWPVHYHTEDHFFVKNRQCLSMAKNESRKATCPLQAGSHGSGLQLCVKSLSCCSWRLCEPEKAWYKAAMWCCQVRAGAGITPEPKPHRNKV